MRYYTKILNTDFINHQTPSQTVKDPLIVNAGIKLIIKREDLNHQSLSGNKWYKLKYNLISAKEGELDTLLTFGGAYSNHIYAVAAAGKLFGFKTIGIIRGEEHLSLNPALKFVNSAGMKLFYIDRTTYREKNSAEFLNYLKEKFGKFYLIP